MTYKKKLMMECPADVDSRYIGGCSGCPSRVVPGAPSINYPECSGPNNAACAKCWNTEIPEKTTDTKPTTSVDIHNIIDDAMEKKDRTVSIFIGEHGTSVDVRPLSNEKPRWIMRFRDETEKRARRHIGYKCSECGETVQFISPYCPACGEKLAAPSMEEKGS